MNLGLAWFTSNSLFFFPSSVLFVGDGVLLPFIILTFPFPLLTFIISPIPVMKEIPKAENDDGRVEGVVEVPILRGAEIEEEQL